MVAQLRGERMVAHNITDPPLLRSLLRRRRTFFVENSSIMFTLWFPSIAPVDEIQMKPCFVMATLIIRSQAECFPKDGEITMFVHFSKALRAGWLEKSADVCPVVRNGSGSPQRCVARWRRQGTIRKGFVNSTDVVSAATAPRCSIEITCNQVNLLRNCDSTKSEDELLGDAFSSWRRCC